MTAKSSFVVVANRLPVDRVAEAAEGEVEAGAAEGGAGAAEDGARAAEDGAGWRRSPGGLVTALQPVLAARKGIWVGWLGDTSGHGRRAPEPFELDELRLRPVPLTSEDVSRYYEGFANSSLWPLYHDAVEHPIFKRRWWESYRRVNQRFAEATADSAAPGATVWVQDYQLQLMPALLRQLRPDLKIGFFLHIPFPPVELFMQLPRRTEVLSGLLGADLVGFQRPGGARNFLDLTRHVLHLKPHGNTVVAPDGRTVVAQAFPISIDVAEMERLAATEEVKARAKEIRAELGNPQTVLLGVDRLDYTKGIERRLKAYRELLAEGRLSVPESVMVQVATPSRERIEHYQALRGKVEREVGRINGEYGRVGTPAVHYLHQSYSRAELAALYRAADVMMVTPLRDGMNLVAKEYVATQIEDRGALVLSEFAGAFFELRQAFGCNPHDLDDVKQAVLRALEAPQTERRRRMRHMRRYLRAHDVSRWAQSFLACLGESGPGEPGPGEPGPGEPGLGEPGVGEPGLGESPGLDAAEPEPV